MVRTDSGTTRPRSASPSRPPRSRRRRAAPARCTADAVHQRAVHRAEVDDDEAVGGGADLGVAPRGPGVGERAPCSRRSGRARWCPRRAGPGGRRAARASPPGRPRPRRSRPTTSKSPVFSVSSGTSVTVTGPDEVVALVAGVLPRGLGELAGEGVGERLEALEVGGREVHADVVRRDGAAAHAERAAVVEHADQPVTDLDGLEPAAEGLVEGALDQPLEPALEPLESHGRRVYRASSFSADARPLVHRMARTSRQLYRVASGHVNASRRPSDGRSRYPGRTPGRVAELADAQASGACVRKDVGVQVPPRPRTRRPQRSTTPRSSGPFDDTALVRTIGQR